MLQRDISQVLTQQKQTRDEQRQQKQDTLLSIIGPTTVPFALISGLIGMNTDLSERGKSCGLEVGKVPCFTFGDVIVLCVFLSIAIFFIYRYILKWNSTDPVNPKSDGDELKLGGEKETPF